MKVDLITQEDLQELKQLLEDIKGILQTSSGLHSPKYVRSKEMRELLGGISGASLSNYRAKGLIPYVNLDGSFFYDVTSVMKALKDLETVTRSQNSPIEFSCFTSPPPPLYVQSHIASGKKASNE